MTVGEFLELIETYNIDKEAILGIKLLDRTYVKVYGFEKTNDVQCPVFILENSMNFGTDKHVEELKNCLHFERTPIMWRGEDGDNVQG